MAKGPQKKLAILGWMSGETVLKRLRIKCLVRICAPGMLSDGLDLPGLRGLPDPPTPSVLWVSRADGAVSLGSDGG
jgi:hypothetical protein